MKFLTASDGSLTDWAHVIVDSVPYSIHRKQDKIQCDADNSSDVALFMGNSRHRKNVANKAHIVHLENDTQSKRSDGWSVKIGGKSISINWWGELMDSKKAFLVSAADQNTTAKSMFGLDYSQLDASRRAIVDAEVAKNPSQSQPSAPPAHNPTLTPLSLAPGQSSLSVRWFRAADENPFAKKDDDAKDDEGDDKKEDKKPPFPPKKKEDNGDDKDDKKDDKKDSKKPPFPPKKKDDSEPKKDKAPKKDAPKGDEKDAADAKKAIDILEKLLKNEESEDEPHAGDLVEAIELLKKFLEEEEKEDHGMPGGPAKPMDGPSIPMKIDLKPMPPMGGPVGPKPAGPKPAPFAGPMSGFEVGDSVWRKADVGLFDSIDIAPGRVVDIGGGKVVVDWGENDDILAEENPADLLLADRTDGEETLFSSSTNVEVIEESEASEGDVKSEIEAILARTSLRDLLNKESSDESSQTAIVHLGTNTSGEYLAKGADGRFLVRLAGEERFVWPYEIRFVDQTQVEEN